MNAWVRLLLALFIDLLIRSVFNLQQWSPDIVVITLVYLTMTRPAGEAYFMAFLCGLVWDAVFLDLLGMHSILFLLASVGAVRLRTLIWGQYAVSRLILGFIFSGGVRFFEVIFWLSTLDYDVQIQASQQYVFYGAVVSGLLFMFIPWNRRSVSQKTEEGVLMYGRTFAS